MNNQGNNDNLIDVIREIQGNNPQNQQTITFTLNPAPSMNAANALGISAATPGLTGLAAVSSAAPNVSGPGHGPVTVHYGGGSVHYGNSLSAATPGLSGLAAVSSSAPTSVPSSVHSVHYGDQTVPAVTSVQNNMQPNKMPGPQSYVVATGPMGSSVVCGADGEDVSLHMGNPISNQGPPDGGSANSDQSIHSSGNQSEQRLKVEDALNYLDQVKYKFGNQPQVYNDFLDIMKEFKSQSIDTPGVIARVSHLFRGHPELIVGFNTFLPPGYKIEVQTNDQVSLSMNLQGGGYVVTTVQPGIVPGGSPGHPAAQPTSTIIHSVPGLPIRTSVTHPPHTAPQTVFGNPTVVNNGRISPIPPPSNLASVTNSFETGTTPTFTHSFSSPFVQSAFPSLQSQPVEFNHAINYVNKIKNRFQGQPDKYKQFLEILHTYQKEQRNIKEGLPPSSKHLTEHEVYSQVAKLFENQEDLLQEFGQFLPDATNHQNTGGIKTAIDQVKKSTKMAREFPVVTTTAAPIPPKPVGPPPPVTAPKRPTLQPVPTTSKKMKLSSSFKDISLSEAGKYGTLNEFAFFDKVRQSLKGQDIYDNFLRCLSLYNEEVISRTELIQLVAPFLSKLPELYAWFKDFLGHNETATVPQYETIPQGAARSEKLTEEQSMEIDFSTCKRLGASYCALPKNHIPPKCSGRTSLNKEVLNDVWVSFPTWSEDSTFITSRKTQFEEYIYRCEDERFELDVVIETNASTIRVLEAVAKKMSRMSPEELQDFHLDQCMGGTSPTIHQRAVRRLYGEKSAEIIEGLKKHPVVAVPLVLRRLKAKEEEWREAQKGFNKIWREQVERFYLKSLDHQGITFKQSDIRALRSKSLINEIETLFDERHEQQSNEIEPENATGGPHISLLYRNREILDDACNLLLHHVRRQSTIGKDDKRKIKQLLKHFVSDLFHHPRIDLSDDENDDYSQDEIDSRKSPSEYLQNGSRNGNKRNGTSKRNNGSKQGTSGSRKDFDDLRFDSNASNAADASTSFGYTQRTPGESQESRRTLAKRELKQLSENTRFRNETMDTDRNTDEFSGRAAKDVSSSMRNRRDCDESELERHLTSKMLQIENHDLDEQYTLFYVNNCWYVFLRLHQILCERLTRMLETAVNIMNEEAKEGRDEKNSPAVNLRLKPKREIEVQEYYATFLEMVRSLLDGNTDANTYEDTLREMFGIHAYVAYTMDKVVANAVRQLQTLVSEEMCQLCHDLYQQASKRGGTGGYCTTAPQRVGAELSYQKKAEKTFVDDNCIKVVIYQKQCRMAMELMEVDAPTSVNREDPLDQRAKFSSYFERFVNPGDIVSDDLRRELCQKPIFLPRNIRKWKRTRQHTYLNETRNKIVRRRLEDHSLTSNDEIRIEENQLESKRDRRRNMMDTIEVDRSTQRDKPGSSKQNPSSSGDSDNSEIKPGMDVEEMERILLSKSQRRGASNDIMLDDSLQCHFNPTSFKMVFVVNSENFIYLKGSLRRARETHKKVSKRLDTAFSIWHQRWLEENVTEEQLRMCTDFLISRYGVTRVLRNNDTRKSPYRPINRYKVEGRKISQISD